MNKMHTISVPYSVMKTCPLSWVQRVHAHKGNHTHRHANYETGASVPCREQSCRGGFPHSGVDIVGMLSVVAHCALPYKLDSLEFELLVPMNAVLSEFL